MGFESDCRVAVLCTGLDSKLRGYETHQRTLFDCLTGEDIDVTLYKRDGSTIKGKEIALHTPSHRSIISKLASKFYDTPLQCQMAFFAVIFVTHTVIARNKFDYIMIIEPGLLRVLHKMRKCLPGKPKLVYTHGINNHPKYYYQYCDEIIEVSEPAYEVTEEFKKVQDSQPGIWLIPHFIQEEKFSNPEMKDSKLEELKQNLGIKTEKVLLHVGVVCRKPKNVDYIINEFSNVPDNWTLLLVGSVLDNDLLELGYEKFGERLVHVTFPRDEMWIPYSIADLLVFASTEEGFGLVIIEALACDLPLLLPDIPLYRWIIKDNERMLYPLSKGALAKKINSDFLKTTDKNESNKDIFINHYSWTSVKPLYAELLRKS